VFFHCVRKNFWQSLRCFRGDTWYVKEIICILGVFTRYKGQLDLFKLNLIFLLPQKLYSRSVRIGRPLIQYRSDEPLVCYRDSVQEGAVPRYQTLPIRRSSTRSCSPLYFELRYHKNGSLEWYSVYGCWIHINPLYNFSGSEKIKFCS
jgi:hypothetical protein